MMTAKKFWEMLSRITGTDNKSYLKALCWLVAHLERKYWKQKCVDQYIEVWNVLYMTNLTMPVCEKLQFPNELLEIIESV